MERQGPGNPPRFNGADRPSMSPAAWKTILFVGAGRTNGRRDCMGCFHPCGRALLMRLVHETEADERIIRVALGDLNPKDRCKSVFPPSTARLRLTASQRGTR
jgi:hypothetical protein